LPIINSKIRYAFGCLIFVVFLVASLVSCINSNNSAENVYRYDRYLKTTPEIRVLLHDNIEEIQIEISKPYSISNFNNHEKLADKAGLKKVGSIFKSR